MILGFALSKQTNQILEVLHVDQKIFVNDPTNFLGFVSQIINLAPDYIIGLGGYSGRDRKTLRVETACTNKFRNSFVDSSALITHSLNAYIQPNTQIKLAKGIGNSYCNLFSYLLINELLKIDSKSHYNFVHIPKNFNSENAITLINNQLVNL